MQSMLNPISDMYQTQLEASRRFADVVFSGTKKIDRVCIEAAQHAFSENLNFVQALASTRDPKGVANLQSKFFSPQPDNAIGYQKEMMRIFAEIQNEVGKSMQDIMEKFGTNVTSNASAPLRAAQGQAGDMGFNPLAGMFSMWESAFKEVTSLANRNMNVVRHTYEDAANAATTAAQATAAAAVQSANSGISEVSESVKEASLNGSDVSARHSSGGKNLHNKKTHASNHSRSRSK